MINIIFLILFILWVYLLSVLKRTKLVAFHFILGSVGLFLILLILSKPVVIRIMSQLVTILAGAVGSLTQTFTTAYQYSLIYVNTAQGVVIMFIDSECSGVIESAAYIALLSFFPLYKRSEKQLLSIIGVLWILLANVLRILLITFIVYFFGKESFYFAHAILGRVVFYILTIILYFNVFTRSHVVKQMIGSKAYEITY